MGIGRLAIKMLATMGNKVIDSLDEATKNPKKYQEELLMKIIETSKDSEYGKLHHFEEIHSVADFQARVPLNEYDDFAPYIEKMVKGEKNILTGNEINHYNETSGTVGTPKMIPVAEQQISLFGRYNALYLSALPKKCFGKKWLKGKCFSLVEGSYEKLPSGATFGSASALSTSRMNKGPFHDMMGDVYTTPIEGRQPLPGTTPRYLHARFALMEKNMTYGNCTFSSYLLEIMRYIESNWELLVRDIETGTIDDSVSIPEETVKSLGNKLRPMKKRAEELRREFEKGFDTPIAPRIWPNFTYFIMAGGAGFLPYTEKLKEKYFGPDIHYLFLGLSASEGYFSIPYKADSFESVFIPDGNFMEFIPIAEEDDKVRTLDELEIGKRYEVVVTNLCGFYRYRMNDCVEVVGKYNNTPTMVFKYRLNNTVSLVGEKTTEAALTEAITKTARELKIPIYDYSVYPDPDKVPLRYIFLLELDQYPCPISKEEFAKVLDRHLGEANPSVGAKLESGIFTKSEIHFLQPETYMLYRDTKLMQGKSTSQLKPVHIIRNEKQRKFFFGLREQEND